MIDDSKYDIGFSRFVHRVLAVVGILLVASGIVALLWFTIYVWFALALGILLAVLLRTLSNHVEQWLKIRRPWALILVLVLGAGLLALGGWLLSGPISAQFRQLEQQLPQAFNRLWQQIEQSPLHKYLPQHQLSAADMAFVSKSVAPQLAGLFRVTFTAVVGAVVALFIGLYMAFKPAIYTEGFLRLLPISKRPRGRDILSETGKMLGRWILGQLLAMACVGFMIGLGLYLSGIPLSLALGIIAGALDCIPIIGPILAAIPAVLLGFTVGVWHALLVVAVFVGSTQVEQHLLLPVIHRYAVWLPPAVTLFALALMTVLFGIVGALLATPLAAIALILLKRLYIEDILGDRGDRPP